MGFPVVDAGDRGEDLAGEESPTTFCSNGRAFEDQIAQRPKRGRRVVEDLSEGVRLLDLPGSVRLAGCLERVEGGAHGGVVGQVDAWIAQYRPPRELAEEPEGEQPRLTESSGSS
jgi:hypothetical protein